MLSDPHPWLITVAHVHNPTSTACFCGPHPWPMSMVLCSWPCMAFETELQGLRVGEPHPILRLGTQHQPGIGCLPLPGASSMPDCVHMPWPFSVRWGPPQSARGAQVTILFWKVLQRCLKPGYHAPQGFLLSPKFLFLAGSGTRLGCAAVDHGFSCLIPSRSNL